VFGEGRLHRGQAPILGRGHELTDPLPQALVLTAIVIGFAIAAFALALLRRLHDERASPPEEDRDG
jgi:multicomponent K+:H+ antiporter subunit C